MTDNDEYILSIVDITQIIIFSNCIRELKQKIITLFVLIIESVRVISMSNISTSLIYQNVGGQTWTSNYGNPVYRNHAVGQCAEDAIP